MGKENTRLPTVPTALTRQEERILNMLLEGALAILHPDLSDKARIACLPWARQQLGGPVRHLKL